MESKRLQDLDSYSILDSLPEKEYDSITKIAALICDTPISQITLIDKDRQWYKSNYGIDIDEVPREIGFCNHTIQNNGNVLVINDLSKDNRFSENPFVHGDAHARFYVGVPLVSKKGHALGSLCVIDTKPHEISDEKLSALEGLSDQVMTLLELRKSNKALERALHFIKEHNQSLEDHFEYLLENKDRTVKKLEAFFKVYKKFYEESFDERASVMFDELDNISASWKEIVQELKD